MNRPTVVYCLLFAYVLGTGTTTVAQPLNGHPQAFNDGNGPAGGVWSGASTYTHTFDVGRGDGTIEWAVFGPGQFPYSGLNGWTPNPNLLTYAYQFKHTGFEGLGTLNLRVTKPVSNLGAASLGNASELAPNFLLLPDHLPDNVVIGYQDDAYLEYPPGISAGLVVQSAYLPASYSATVYLYSEPPPTGMTMPLVAAPNGSLYVPPVSDADYNNNGTVDAADYVLWRKGVLAADGTGPGGTPDGVVNGLDYNFWRAAFGQPAGSGSSLVDTAVPEPGGSLLVLLGLLNVVGRLRMP